jgi:hypothetical protein
LELDLSGFDESGKHVFDTDPNPSCRTAAMFIPDPDFYPSRIPDLVSRIQQYHQERREKNLFVQTFFKTTNIIK